MKDTFSIAVSSSRIIMSTGDGVSTKEYLHQPQLRPDGSEEHDDKQSGPLAKQPEEEDSGHGVQQGVETLL